MPLITLFAGSHVIFALLAQLFSVLLDLFNLLAWSDREKDLEIVLLSQQLRLLQRTRARPLRLARREKVPLALLAPKLIQESKNGLARLSQSLPLFTPETLLR